MHDPFPIRPPPHFIRFTTPLSERLSLSTLPLHIHEIVLAAAAYHTIFLFISPFLSSTFLPRSYRTLPPRTKLNWDVHVVSLVQSLFICGLGLWVLIADEERKQMDWEQRVWGYTGAGGMVEAFAAGYFLWDLWICMNNVGVFGVGLLLHAIAALGVFALGFRPFVNYYGPTFILYELSSPFLNFHWFFDKLHMTGSRPQWYNGIFLLSSFFCCRLLWGPYHSICVAYDVWKALYRSPPSLDYKASPGGVEIMRFAGDFHVPTWLAIVYLGSNITLNSLNFYWFGKMIETIQKRFSEVKGKKGGKVEEDEGVLVEGLMDSSTLITEVVEEDEVEKTDEGKPYAGLPNGSSVMEVRSTEVRRRKD